jgi:hypothetical protein
MLYLRCRMQHRSRSVRPKALPACRSLRRPPRRYDRPGACSPAVGARAMQICRVLDRRCHAAEREVTRYRATPIGPDETLTTFDSTIASCTRCGATPEHPMRVRLTRVASEYITDVFECEGLEASARPPRRPDRDQGPHDARWQRVNGGLSGSTKALRRFIVCSLGLVPA